MILSLTNDDFDSVVQAENDTVLVDFWSSHCTPCLRLAPVFDEVATQTAGVTFAKVNVDEHPDLASRYGIMSIPTLLLFQNGKVVDQSVGVCSKADIQRMISRKGNF